MYIWVHIHRPEDNLRYCSLGTVHLGFIPYPPLFLLSLPASFFPIKQDSLRLVASFHNMNSRGLNQRFVKLSGKYFSSRNHLADFHLVFSEKVSTLIVLELADSVRLAGQTVARIHLFLSLQLWELGKPHHFWLF